MRKGQRPSRHYRRVKTKSGHKKRLINPSISKKKKVVRNSRRVPFVPDLKRAPVKPLVSFIDTSDMEEAIARKNKLAMTQAIYDSNMRGELQAVSVQKKIKDLRKEVSAADSEANSKDLSAKKEAVIDSILSIDNTYDKDSLMKKNLDSLKKLKEMVITKETLDLRTKLWEQKQSDKRVNATIDNWDDKTKIVNDIMKKASTIKDPIEKYKFLMREQGISGRLELLELTAEQSTDPDLLSDVKKLKQKYAKQMALAEDKLPATIIEGPVATPAQQRALEKLEAEGLRSGIIWVDRDGRRVVASDEGELSRKISKHYDRYYPGENKKLIPSDPLLHDKIEEARAEVKKESLEKNLLARGLDISIANMVRQAEKTDDIAKKKELLKNIERKVSANKGLDDTITTKQKEKAVKEAEEESKQMFGMKIDERDPAYRSFLKSKALREKLEAAEYKKKMRSVKSGEREGMIPYVGDQVAMSIKRIPSTIGAPKPDNNLLFAKSDESTVDLYKDYSDGKIDGNPVYLTQSELKKAEADYKKQEAMNKKKLANDKRKR